MAMHMTETSEVKRKRRWQMNFTDRHCAYCFVRHQAATYMPPIKWEKASV